MLPNLFFTAHVPVRKDGLLWEDLLMSFHKHRRNKGLKANPEKSWYGPLLKYLLGTKCFASTFFPDTHSRAETWKKASFNWLVSGGPRSVPSPEMLPLLVPLSDVVNGVGRLPAKGPDSKYFLSLKAIWVAVTTLQSYHDSTKAALNNRHGCVPIKLYTTGIRKNFIHRYSLLNLQLRIACILLQNKMKISNKI